jgi:hypothetical protein
MRNQGVRQDHIPGLAEKSTIARPLS